MADDVENSIKENNLLKSFYPNTKKLQFFFLAKYIFLLILIVGIIICTYFILAAKLSEIIDISFDKTIFEFILALLILLVIGIFVNNLTKLFTRMKKASSTKIDFYEKHIKYSYMDETLANNTIKIPYQNIVRIKTKQNLNDFLLKTGTLVIQLSNKQNSEIPITLTSTPIEVNYIQDIEECHTFLINKKESSETQNVEKPKEQIKIESEKVKEDKKETDKEDSIFYK
ncbi:MAG: hypothetical protein WC755_04150 [Candidatus Woesearchaeota archaeon]|jgi:hypothetical protein